MWSVKKYPLRMERLLRVALHRSLKAFVEEEHIIPKLSGSNVFFEQLPIKLHSVNEQIRTAGLPISLRSAVFFDLQINVVGSFTVTGRKLQVFAQLSNNSVVKFGESDGDSGDAAEPISLDATALQSMELLSTLLISMSHASSVKLNAIELNLSLDASTVNGPFSDTYLRLLVQDIDVSVLDSPEAESEKATSAISLRCGEVHLNVVKCAGSGEVVIMEHLLDISRGAAPDALLVSVLVSTEPLNAKPATIEVTIGEISSRIDLSSLVKLVAHVKEVYLKQCDLPSVALTDIPTIISSSASPDHTAAINVNTTAPVTKQPTVKTMDRYFAAVMSFFGGGDADDDTAAMGVTTSLESNIKPDSNINTTHSNATTQLERGGAKVIRISVERVHVTFAPNVSLAEEWAYEFLADETALIFDTVDAKISGDVKMLSLEAVGAKSPSLRLIYIVDAHVLRSLQAPCTPSQPSTELSISSVKVDCSIEAALEHAELWHASRNLSMLASQLFTGSPSQTVPTSEAINNSSDAPNNSTALRIKISEAMVSVSCTFTFHLRLSNATVGIGAEGVNADLARAAFTCMDGPRMSLCLVGDNKISAVQYQADQFHRSIACGEFSFAIESADAPRWLAWVQDMANYGPRFSALFETTATEGHTSRRISTPVSGYCSSAVIRVDELSAAISNMRFEELIAAESEVVRKVSVDSISAAVNEDIIIQITRKGELDCEAGMQFVMRTGDSPHDAPYADASFAKIWVQLEEVKLTSVLNLVKRITDTSNKRSKMVHMNSPPKRVSFMGKISVLEISGVIQLPRCAGSVKAEGQGLVAYVSLNKTMSLDIEAEYVATSARNASTHMQIMQVRHLAFILERGERAIKAWLDLAEAGITIEPWVIPLLLDVKDAMKASVARGEVQPPAMDARLQLADETSRCEVDVADGEQRPHYQSSSVLLIERLNASSPPFAGFGSVGVDRDNPVKVEVHVSIGMATCRVQEFEAGLEGGISAQFAGMNAVTHQYCTESEPIHLSWRAVAEASLMVENCTVMEDLRTAAQEASINILLAAPHPHVSHEGIRPFMRIAWVGVAPPQLGQPVDSDWCESLLSLHFGPAKLKLRGRVLTALDAVTRWPLSTHDASPSEVSDASNGERIIFLREVVISPSAVEVNFDPDGVEARYESTSDRAEPSAAKGSVMASVKLIPISGLQMRLPVMHATDCTLAQAVHALSAAYLDHFARNELHNLASSVPAAAIPKMMAYAHGVTRALIVAAGEKMMPLAKTAAAQGMAAVTPAIQSVSATFSSVSTATLASFQEWLASGLASVQSGSDQATLASWLYLGALVEWWRHTWQDIRRIRSPQQDRRIPQPKFARETLDEWVML